MALPQPRHKFTVDDYHRMAESGILTRDSRVELLDGQILDKSPLGRAHQACLDRLVELCFAALMRQVIIRAQGSVRLSDLSEPQPDLAILRRRSDFYRNADAGPDDVLLIVEVADTSLRHDLEVKGPLYAQAGVPEYWVVDLSGGAIIVNRDPAPGGYETTFRVRGGETVSPAALHELSVSADQVLG
jgi:Uma2 family endonuclease